MASGWPGGDYLQRPLDELLADVSGNDPAPAAGSVTAASLALAAALTAKVARRSTRHVSDAGALADIADASRDRVVPLITGDAASYAAVLAAKRGGHDGSEPDAETMAMAEALRIPIEIAVVAADVVELAIDLADRGNPNLRHDAIAAADLAAQCASVAASLAQANAGDPSSPRADAADEAVLAAAHAARAAGGIQRG
ncbi:cyclodeaminase/cyclohydrolase family protein [Arthrobacter pigmenti]